MSPITAKTGFVHPPQSMVNFFQKLLRSRSEKVSPDLQLQARQGPYPKGFITLSFSHCDSEGLLCVLALKLSYFPVFNRAENPDRSHLLSNPAFSVAGHQDTRSFMGRFIVLKFNGQIKPLCHLSVRGLLSAHVPPGITTAVSGSCFSCHRYPDRSIRRKILFNHTCAAQCRFRVFDNCPGKWLHSLVP